MIQNTPLVLYKKYCKITHMYRIYAEQLSTWWHEKKRKPLVLRGARQVGKSTLVRQFAQTQGLDLYEINLEMQPLRSLDFEGYDIPSILREIEEVCGKSVASHKSLLFFDEIQANPKALTALRYFYELRPDLPVIAAGSFLDLFLNEDHAIAVPVGRISYLHIQQMSFIEFLIALDQKILVQRMNHFQDINEATHQKIWKFYRDYLFVGGMPESIKTYIETMSFVEVRKVQESLLQTYQDDFFKYSKKAQLQFIRQVFDYIPFHCGEKVKYSEINADAKSIEIRKAIDLLSHALVAKRIYHTNASGLPLSALVDEKIFKLFFLDVGLMLAKQNVSFASLLEKNFITEGPTAEQFVMQNLLARNNGFSKAEMFFWMKDKSTMKAQIDFLIQYQNEIIPIEIKAGKSGSIKSLWQFIHEKKIKRAIHFGNHLPLIEKKSHKSLSGDGAKSIEVRLYQLPIYLAEQVEVILKLD